MVTKLMDVAEIRFTQDPALPWLNSFRGLGFRVYRSFVSSVLMRDRLGCLGFHINLERGSAAIGRLRAESAIPIIPIVAPFWGLPFGILNIKPGSLI